MAASVASVSLLSIVGWCGTPRVHTAAAVIPDTDARPSVTELVSVVITRVQSVTRGADGGLELGVGVRLDTCCAFTSEGRLNRSFHRFAGDGGDVAVHVHGLGVAEVLWLPANVGVGDIIVVR